ncbi:hypothetical protein [uncultured Alcanivorax sp.]|jgi:hypothetical protein|uniref:hypothetical protein n=1 Tax=uncultured Alcanivorax sp. TaxID=191215 RepID=UPI0025883CDF|nr:hypothetical protein [uncultured Alcanivorax sp.]
MGNQRATPRSIASKLYAQTIKHRMGDISFGKIERELLSAQESSGPEFWVHYPRKLYRYANGAPISLKRSKTMLDTIEAILPGTRRILEHPLWLVLANPEASSGELDSYTGILDPALIERLKETDKVTGNRAWRKWTDRSQLYRISMLNNMDALAALLILIRVCEIKKWVHPYIEAKWTVIHLISRLASFRPFIFIAEELYHQIYEKFILRNSPLPDTLTPSAVQYFPAYFSSPPIFHTIYREIQANTGIVWHAAQLGLVEENEREQMMFLFWVLHFFDRTTIDKQLKELTQAPASFDELPEPLSTLMENFRGDSRRYLPRQTFLG